LIADSDKLKELESVFQKLAVRLSSGIPLEEKDEIQETIDRVFDAIRELNAIYGRLLARLDEDEK
jgi:arylsulfatase A-like enzyme